MAKLIRRNIPSVDRILRSAPGAALAAAHGRGAVLAAVRDDVDRLRASLQDRGDASVERIAARVAAELESAAQASLRPVFNLTGTILHTNLGRALLPREAVEAIGAVAAQAVSLEYNLEAGRRGERDRHLEGLLVGLTGAERATVVNNNAAALLLALNTLALRREVVVSRGELVEIGGEFRLPEIMRRAGCKLVEVGTTNRTHARDYAEAIGPRTALVMKVHPSNYRIVGFAKAVDEKPLAALAHQRGLPLLSDLGSGALLDLRRWGLPRERTAAEAIAAGADLVTFSGDKLLGGPQAGIIAGRAELVARINRNALKRALRLDKLRIAALGAVLRLYADPDRLAARLPALRLMSRPLAEIEQLARRLLPAVSRALAGRAAVTIEGCESEAGSGSLPEERIASAALEIRPGAGVEKLARAWRALPVPVIGRIHDGALVLDLRCLEDDAGFLAQLDRLSA
ncbi:MAG: L-seryl-tRNA(Sec) selenium transferase [Betaproteobacteria bacterium RIFCSPLOWO2_12_FULL_68_20]|nr:MAG: L-seryl-tRNA(Sec) selenium transferase [Betaproteobacteria bacterium RIFCSPLOWO2_12_FULL_68_20]